MPGLAERETEVLHVLDLAARRTAAPMSHKIKTFAPDSQTLDRRGAGAGRPSVTVRPE